MGGADEADPGAGDEDAHHAEEADAWGPKHCSLPWLQSGCSLTAAWFQSDCSLTAVWLQSRWQRLMPPLLQRGIRLPLALVSTPTLSPDHAIIRPVVLSNFRAKSCQNDKTYDAKRRKENFGCLGGHGYPLGSVQTVGRTQRREPPLLRTPSLQ